MLKKEKEEHLIIQNVRVPQLKNVRKVIFKKYLPIKTLAKSQYSVVFLAKNIKDNKYVAVKMQGKDAKSSDGSEWHGIFKLGNDKNKVIVYFFGGGVSITPKTSEGGKEFYATNMMAQDFVALGGIGSDAEENPFKDWTKIVVPYASGDFHTGTGEYHYKDSNGKEKIIYHNGYNNYTLLMNEVKNMLIMKMSIHYL